jgi:hypothetical protein
MQPGKPEEILSKMYDDGSLKSLVMSGIISPDVMGWYRINAMYKHLLSSGKKTHEAVKDTADFFRLSDRSIYRIIAKFK